MTRLTFGFTEDMTIVHGLYEPTCNGGVTKMGEHPNCLGISTAPEIIWISPQLGWYELLTLKNSKTENHL